MKSKSPTNDTLVVKLGLEYFTTTNTVFRVRTYFLYIFHMQRTLVIITTVFVTKDFAVKLNLLL